MCKLVKRIERVRKALQRTTIRNISEDVISESGFVLISRGDYGISVADKTTGRLIVIGYNFAVLTDQFLDKDFLRKVSKGEVDIKSVRDKVVICADFPRWITCYDLGKDLHYAVSTASVMRDEARNSTNSTLSCRLCYNADEYIP